MMQDQYTLNSNTANQFHEETPDQSQNSLNSNANPNQLLCEELEGFKNNYTKNTKYTKYRQWN
ncbi:hypothetical protein RirG_007460 [Rhizophagus irregularis DAOM 197198w]|uniref:Uncharacterized protein n=1 Tax=Rhizophagus irregularis (strain DAOM 197198w) TaxID=1432141 RepID=A0A015LHU3_RHIIW|nr:hypothetical protein RirG_007460 [Rhizophagus irregularis DAOM 197198w]